MRHPSAPLVAALLCLAVPAVAQQTPIVLKGTVVTMDDAFTVVKDGGVVVQGGKIVSILKAGEAGPSGAVVINSKGKIFPGMINLHDHIAYNFLPLYPVPKHYDNRDQWPGGKLYEALVNNPKTLVTDPGYYDKQTEALKYAEIKALAGGVTTTQGSPTDAGTSGILVRNVELPNWGRDKVGQRGLPIDGMYVKGIAAEKASVAKLDAWLFHLSEGMLGSAYSRREYYNSAYTTTKNPGPNNQAGLKNIGVVMPQLVGIHSAALTAADFNDWKATAGSPPKVVWSPLSNFLLYGTTTDVPAARAAGGIVALGTDWSPSGSKSLLWELKFASVVNTQKFGGKLTNKDLVAMVTSNPAKIVKWTDKVGSIKPGMVADLVVIDAVNADPYKAIVDAKESHVQLVLIGGDALYGDEKVLKSAKPSAALEVVGSPGGRKKCIDLKRTTDYYKNKPVPKGTQTLAEIKSTLLDAFKYEPATLAAILNKGRGPTGDKKPRTTLKAWLSAALKKVNKPVPADVGDANANISAASVQIFLDTKFPNRKPNVPLDPIYQQGDTAYFNAVKANLHFTQGALNLAAYLKYAGP